jgi:hypothetical protein
VDITASDQRINLMPKRRSILNGVAAGVVMTGISTYEAISSLDDLITLVFCAGFFVGGIVLSAGSVILLLSKRVAVFGNNAVEVTGHSTFRKEAWREPYSGYKGVLHRETSVSRGGADDGEVFYQIIELSHADPEKNVPLLVERSESMPRDAWEAYAKWLHLPAMTTIEGEMTTRELEDLDKSIAELAADGKIAPRQDFSDAPPPKGLHVVRENSGGGESLRVDITVPRAHLVVRLLVCGVPTVFCLILTAIGMADAITLLATLGGLGALVFIVLGFEWARRDKRARRDILITRTKLTVTDPWQGWPLHQQTFDLSEIETITLQPRGAGLMIARDQTQIDIGAGLSKEALMWLKDYLTSAVATA